MKRAYCYKVQLEMPQLLLLLTPLLPLSLPQSLSLIVA